MGLDNDSRRRTALPPSSQPNSRVSCITVIPPSGSGSGSGCAVASMSSPTWVRVLRVRTLSARVATRFQISWVNSKLNSRVADGPAHLHIEPAHRVLCPDRRSRGFPLTYVVKVAPDERAVRKGTIERAFPKTAHRAFTAAADRESVSDPLTPPLASHADLHDHPVSQSHLVDLESQGCTWCGDRERLPF